MFFKASCVIRVLDSDGFSHFVLAQVNLEYTLRSPVDAVPSKIIMRFMEGLKYDD